MDEASVVVKLLDRLSAGLRGCRVREPALRERILAAHRDSGWEEDANIVVVLRGSCNPRDLQALDEITRGRFGAPLPAGLRALLSRHDGMWVGDVEEGTSEKELLGSGYEAGIFSASQIAEHVRCEICTETSTDGSQLKHYHPVLPFFDVPDQGWHALDFTRRAADGLIPVVTYYFDEARGDSTEHCEVIAPCFARWFEGWVESGFSTFWHDQSL